jgi:tetratricopeptide (TPR) repeat protein
MHERTNRLARRPRAGAPPQGGRGGLGASMASLQGAVGNAGMGVLARKPAAKAAAAKKLGYKPYSLTFQQENWDYATLVGHAADMRNQGDLPQAAALYEKAYELNPRRDIAFNLYRIYKDLKDDEKAEHWLGVANGKPHENTPPVSYQQF